MKKIILPLCFFLTAATSFSQSSQDAIELDFGFEQNASGGQIPNNWVQWGTGYKIETDTLIKNRSKRSVRIEADTNKNAKSIGALAYAISSNFNAKEIELRARMKLKHIKNGSAGLMVRLDGPSGMVLTYENTLGKNIQGTKKWSAYSLKARFPENVKTIYIGAMLSGDGQLWVDDFQILLDGKILREAQVVKQEDFISFLPKESDRGSAIPKIILSQSNIADLDVLGKVWGFLKYYHPAVAGGKYDWDHELFRILPKILEAKSSDERNSVLNAWVASLGSFNKRNFDDTKGLEVKILPDLSWIDPTVLGNDLVTSLNEVKVMERANDHYYIRMVPGVGNPDFKNELSYNMMTYPDVGLQLLGLYRYWNIIQYFFPYKNLIHEDWNKVLAEYIPTFINAGSDLEYKLAALSIIARIHDTHANIWSVDETLNNYKGRRYGPMKITFVENKAVITDYLDTTLCEKAGLKIGDIIESVNGRSVSEIIKEKQPFTPASNFPTQLRDIARDLVRTNQSTLDLEYSRGDITKSTQIETVSQLHLKTKFHNGDTCFKLINKEIAYLYPGSVKNKYLPMIMAEVEKSKGLIIDFRCYPSDFIVFSLSEYILPEKKSFVKFSKASVTSPGLFTMTKELKVGNVNPGYYKGKIVIIINEMTQSSAEYHTMAFRRAPNAIVIGSTTAAADGNVSRFFLPGSISTMISGIGVYDPDGSETQRVGIIPDIEVKPTVKGIREGRDELLEKAIAIIN